MEKNTYQSIGSMDFAMAGSGTDTACAGKPSGAGGNRKKILWMAAAAILLVAAVLIAVKVLDGSKKEKEYSVVGEWNSRDLMNVEAMFVDILETEVGLDFTTAQAVAEFLGLDDERAVLTFWFMDSGAIDLSAGGLSIGGNPLSYEILDKDTMLLRFEMNVDLWAVTIPINISYTADYKVTEDRLTLDLFGYKVTFDRLK